MDTQNVIEPFIGDGKLVKPCPHGGMTYASFMTEVITQSHKRPYQVMLVSQDETMVLVRKLRVLPEHENLQAGHQRWKFEPCDKFPFQLLKKIGNGWFWQSKNEQTNESQYQQVHVLFDRLEYVFAP
jgi:hypothetical protein